MISANYFWPIIIALAIGTFTIRSTMIYLSEKFTFTERTKEIFSFIPAAILPALVMPLVYFHNGTSSLLIGKERFVVLFVAFFIAYKSKSMIFTILLGLLSLYLTQLI